MMYNLSKKVIIQEFKIKTFLTYHTDKDEMLVNAHWGQVCEPPRHIGGGGAQISSGFSDQLDISFQR